MKALVIRDAMEIEKRPDCLNKRGDSQLLLHCESRYSLALIEHVNKSPINIQTNYRSHAPFQFSNPAHLYTNPQFKSGNGQMEALTGPSDET